VKASAAATVLTERDRDRKAYALARAYLLDHRAQGITDELLEHYATPWPHGKTPSSMSDVFQRLLRSARNRNMMATVIPDSIVDSLGPLLEGFNPAKVTERFISPDQLLDTIIRVLRPRGKLRRSRGGLWPLFTRATLSGARFLSQFGDGPEFLAWVQVFDDDPRKRAALPMLLSQEIDGFGFALACDFLKELGFVNFAKPDVHVKAIVKGLGLTSDTANDYVVFKTVARVAAHCDASPYAVDKVFWLVGSGRFYDHGSIGRNGRIITNREQFIQDASRALGPAA
jgi:hypothetical protein